MANIYIWLVLFMFCLAGVAAGKTPGWDENFFFVQITDTHLGIAKHHKKTEKIIAAINKLPIEIKFVVHSGDMKQDTVSFKTVNRHILKLKKTLNCPIYFVPGNHDITSKSLRENLTAYKRLFGGLIQKASAGNVQLIFAYTEPLRKGFHVPGYNPLKTLDSILVQLGKKPVLLFHHAPCVRDFYNNQFHLSWPPAARKKWSGLLNKHKVAAVVAGHFHRDEHHWLGSVPLYVSASVANYWGRQSTFRIYEYDKGKLSYRTQYID